MNCKRLAHIIPFVIGGYLTHLVIFSTLVGQVDSYQLSFSVNVEFSFTKYRHSEGASNVSDLFGQINGILKLTVLFTTMGVS